MTDLRADFFSAPRIQRRDFYGRTHFKIMKTSARKWPRVLVGCPTYSGKAYCLTRYAERVKNLDYPNYDVMLVDNSDDSGRYRRRLLEVGLPFLIGPVKGSAAERIAASRNILREYALQNGYAYF